MANPSPFQTGSQQTFGRCQKQKVSHFFGFFCLKIPSRLFRVSNEAQVELFFTNPSKLTTILQSVEKELDNILLVSKVILYPDQDLKISEEPPDVVVGEGTVQCGIGDTTSHIKFSMKISRLKDRFKCPRCWKYYSLQEDQLCHRCQHILTKI